MIASVFLQEIQHMSEQRVIRVAIAGQGRSGYKIHAHWLKQDPARFRIVAVADQLPERRRDAIGEFGARAFKDYRDMLRAGGFDLFVNALPTPLHVPGVLEALRSGYDVVAEKPMAGTVRDFDRMTATARREGRLLAPFQNNRLQPFFLKMREILASGVLGDILYIRSHWGGYARRWDWQTFRRNMGGVLFNTGPHAIDQALALFGDREEPKVFCKMMCHNSLEGDADDFCALSLHGRHSPLIEILISQYQVYPQGEMYNVSGTLGGLTANWNEIRWKYYDPRQAPRPKMWRRWSVDRAYPSETLPWVEESWSLDKEQARNVVGYTLKSLPTGVALFYANVHEAITQKAELLIRPAEVRRQIAVFEECFRQNPGPLKSKAGQRPPARGARQAKARG